MNLREEIGQLITVGGIIGGLGADADTEPVLRAIAAGEVGGVYLGYPHFRDPERALEMTAALQKIAPRPLFCAADFETGPAYNCEGDAAHFPYLMGLGFVDDPTLTAAAAEITGRQALAMGINWVYSPCVDVNLSPDNPIIGIRSFGETPEHVIRMGNAFIRGAREAGVMCTAKHFPGTGNTAADTHVGLARDLGDLKTWEEKTLPPFAEALRAGVDSVMTGHASMPFLDPSDQPATFSRVILTDILRGRMGFQGIVISDSLGMEGAAGEGVPERCLRAFEAGCDVLLTPWHPDIIPAFERAIERGQITHDQVRASVRRVLEAKERLSRLPPSRARVEDGAVAAEIGRRAARIVRGRDRLPLRRESVAILTQWRNDEAQFFPREPGVLASLQHGLQSFAPSAPLIPLTRDCPSSEHRAILDAIGAARAVVLSAIVKNYAGDPYGGHLSEGTAGLIRTLATSGKEVVLVVLGSPYAAARVSEAAVVLCTGGDTPGSVEGVLDLLLGRGGER